MKCLKIKNKAKKSPRNKNAAICKFTFFLKKKGKRFEVIKRGPFQVL